MCVSSYGYCFKMPEFVNFVNFVMAKKIIVLPQRDHIPAGNRARTSIASGLHRPFIG